ncbi:uncharacterized protein EDB91DRAFT_1087746 [Suillus paluster]|uniref:uncharacterized protein n=1 Tax=Suillus paluster TaxID=48578 RepID=UPI001B87B85A|nr:uncharacterized protein EDB91DRAFT_1087746 [Suillus paluster]KAG1723674.1 hypothetical protein EDB91DRAFT_1087746 [Suillus paluster]
MGPPVSIRNNNTPGPSVIVEDISTFGPWSTGPYHTGYYTRPFTRIIRRYPARVDYGTYDFSGDFTSSHNIADDIPGPSTLPTTTGFHDFINGIPGPSALPITTGPSVIPAIPETRVTPPTPTFQIDPVLVGCDLDDVLMNDSDDDILMDHSDDGILMDGSEGTIPAVKGWRSDVTNAILRKGFVDMEHLMHELSREASIPTHQVISWWNKNHTRSINRVNHWNAYSSYFKDNLSQELDQLSGKAPNIPGTPSTTVCCNCYKLFKVAYPDSWQTILEHHGQSVLLSGVPQTVSMRTQEFDKFCKKIIAVMDGGAAQFRFEAALVACGKVINQDGGLSLAHTTAGAAGFWLLHCKTDNDTIIRHLKAQVYNSMSLAIVEETFPGDNNVSQLDMPNKREASITLSDNINISKDGTRWIKAEIYRQLRTTPNLGGKFLSSKKFPWNTLPAELTCQGMMIKGYPEDVILPGEHHASKSKGIANLTLKEVGEVIMALKAGTMQLKKVSEDKQGKILTSECPVVEGACPPADSIHTAGHCLFANGKSDRNGLACEKPSKAVTKRKGKTSQKAPAFCTSPISLSDNSGDSNSDDPSGPPIKPIGRPPPSREFKVVVLPKQQMKVMKPKEVISLVSSNAQSDNGTTKEADSNYEDKAVSKKWKAKSEASSRAAKKRASSPEAPVPKVNKGKAPMRAKGQNEKVAKPEIVESSDNEMADNTAKRLRDGPPELKECPKPRPVKPAVKSPVTSEETNSTNASTVSDHTELTANATAYHAELNDRLPPWSEPPVSPSPTRRQPSHMLVDHIVPAATAPESVTPAPSDNAAPAPSDSVGPASASPNDKRHGETDHVLVQQGDLATEPSCCREYPYARLISTTFPMHQVSIRRPSDTYPFHPIPIHFVDDKQIPSDLPL